MKKLLCKILGHKPKEYPPIKYWVEEVGAVDSPNKPVFCERCGCGEIDIMLDAMQKSSKTRITG